MLPFDKAKSVQTHKYNQYSNDYEASSKGAGFSKKILSIVQVSLDKIRLSQRIPRIA